MTISFAQDLKANFPLIGGQSKDLQMSKDGSQCHKISPWGSPGYKSPCICQPAILLRVHIILSYWSLGESCGIGRKVTSIFFSSLEKGKMEALISRGVAHVHKVSREIDLFISCVDWQGFCGNEVRDTGKSQDT